MIKILNLDAAKNTPFGVLICHLYYSGFLRAVLNFDEFYGYPHNGSQHTLRLKIDNDDLLSFLDIVDEEYRSKEIFKTGFSILYSKVQNHIL